MAIPYEGNKLSRPSIVVLHGDETGEELLQEAMRVLSPNVIGTDLELQHFDLSLRSRRATRNRVVLEAADALKLCGLGIKAATITPETKDDVGSPNAILRDAIKGTVIVRTGRRIPGVASHAGLHAPISVVRMAVNDAYGAREWRDTEEGEERSFRTEMILRRDCRAVAEYSFHIARRDQAMVFGGPKFTVSPVYEGTLKEEMDAAHERYPDVPYRPQLIDATFALLLTAEGPLVIPALNRDGDLLSDLVMQLFGSIAGAESLVLSFRPDFTVAVAMSEAPHGTAPALQGKNIANPMAMILAAGAMLEYSRDVSTQRHGRIIRAAVMETVEGGVRTPDIGGGDSTSRFTDAVIDRVTALAHEPGPKG